MHFGRENKAILAKMETFVNRQVQKMTEKFDFLLVEDEPRREEEDEIGEDVIEVQSDEDDVEGNETVVSD